MNVIFYKLLPKRLLSALMYRLARITKPRWLKNALIKTYMTITGANTQFADKKNPLQYPTLNAFFTRGLAAGARDIDPIKHHLTSPVDGRCAQFGQVQHDTLLQAKNSRYSLATLLGSQALAETFQQAHTATLYLAPDDYHRIHMPCAGRLVSMHFYPGNKHSVALPLLEKIPNLFATNERAVCVFDTDFGQLALVLVGALNVSSIETVWHGEILDTGDNHYYYEPDTYVFEKGDEMGRFNLGSTVILLVNHPNFSWHEHTLASADKILMGQAIASVPSEK